MEATENRLGETIQQHSVSITTPSDNCDLFEVGDLLRSLLLAWGFQPDNVNDLIAQR